MLRSLQHLKSAVFTTYCAFLFFPRLHILWSSKCGTCKSYDGLFSFMLIYRHRYLLPFGRVFNGHKKIGYFVTVDFVKHIFNVIPQYRKAFRKFAIFKKIQTILLDTSYQCACHFNRRGFFDLQFFHFRFFSLHTNFYYFYGAPIEKDRSTPEYQTVLFQTSLPYRAPRSVRRHCLTIRTAMQTSLTLKPLYNVNDNKSNILTSYTLKY